MEENKREFLLDKKQKLIDNILLYGPFGIAALIFIACLVIELVPIELSPELRAQIYDIGGAAAYFFSILLCILYGRKYKLGWIRSIVFGYLCFALVFSKVSVIWRDIDLKMLGAASVASFRSSLFLPVLCFVLSWFCKHNTLTLCDYMTPYFFFRHGITTHFCWIVGCCAGKKMAWGVVDPNTGLHTFPAQPYAIILSLSVSLWGLLYARKNGYKTGGKVYAVSLIVYGFFRYIMEFFTDDLRVLGALSVYSICSLIMVLLGVLIYFWKPKRSVKIKLYKTTENMMEEQI